jgi:citrate synthase
VTADRWSDEWLRTGIGHVSTDSISVRGRDLAGELMGEVSFADLAFLLASGRIPTPQESSLFNAVLASLAEHGLTPTVLAARLTYTGAPESMQGAIAAGLLGAGRVFLGPVEDTARFLEEVLARVPPERRSDDAALGRAAEDAVAEAAANGLRVPGLGHPVHKEVDPRTPRLYALARAAGLYGPHLRALEVVARAQRELGGRALPINGAGAAGAALADLGFSPLVCRGFALLARTAGLVAHLAEESERPIGMRLWEDVERRSGRARREQDEPD